MTGPTHRKYSVCFAFIATVILYRFNFTSINYYLSLIIILMASKAGAIFPDLDHDWRNVGVKTVPNWIINKIIHITGGKHRSWQTHSIDICTWFTVIAINLPIIMYNKQMISEVNKEMLSILMIGFASGWISHLYADMLTGEGVRLIFFINKKIRLVPKKLGPLVFNTGHEWEKFNYKVMSVINVILGLACLIYPFIIGYLEIYKM